MVKGTQTWLWLQTGQTGFDIERQHTQQCVQIDKSVKYTRNK